MYLHDNFVFLYTDSEDHTSSMQSYLHRCSEILTRVRDISTKEIALLAAELLIYLTPSTPRLSSARKAIAADVCAAASGTQLVGFDHPAPNIGPLPTVAGIRPAQTAVALAETTSRAALQCKQIRNKTKMHCRKSEDACVLTPVAAGPPYRRGKLASAAIVQALGSLYL